MSNGHDVFAHWASTRPPVPAVGSLTPNQILDLYLGEMALGVDAGNANDANPAVGTWAIVTELGTGDIITLAATPSRRGRHGPSGTVVWSTPDGSGNFITNTSMRVFDAIGISSIVSAPSLLIGDNITAKKWASVDTVTLGNKHIRIAYHWIKEHVRDQDIDLRDTPSKLNLADFLTKNLNGPAIRAFADLASGYAELPVIPAKT